jgi:hypothetical protein
MLRVVIIVLSLVVVGLVVALWPLLRNPAAARRRIEALFRRPEKPRPLEPDHYYRPYWS